MGVTVGLLRASRMGVASLLAIVVAIPLAPPALAADPVLPAPKVVVRFLTDVTFSGTATLPGDVKRVEVVLDVQGSTRSFVADAAPPGSSGTVALEYVLESPGGALSPNTTLTARFRATMQDGTSVLGPATTVRYDDTRLDWLTLQGEFVTVHWTAGGNAFGQRAQEIADDAVREVSALFGVEAGQRIDFFIYANRDDFYDVLGAATRENVGGEAHTEIRTLFANIGAGSIDSLWVRTVIPHELTHLVFDSAVGNPYQYPPRWLNEGIAAYLSEGYGPGDRADVAAAVKAGEIMPLQALAGQFPTTGDRFRLAYAESVSAVSFLVESYGHPAMVALVQSYADGVTDDQAFQAAIGLDVAGFEAAWLASVGAPAPSPYGPVSAPAGPVPSDWVGGGPDPGHIPGASATPAPTPPPDGPGPGEPAARGAAAVLPVLIGIVAAGVLVVLLFSRRRRPR